MKKQDPKKQKGIVEESAEIPFPEIERLIQSEDFTAINKVFTKAYEELEKISKERGGLGKSREARKAMKAIERTMDLLRDLLKLKYQMMGSQDPGSSKKNQKKLGKNDE